MEDNSNEKDQTVEEFVLTKDWDIPKGEHKFTVQQGISGAQAIKCMACSRPHGLVIPHGKILYQDKEGQMRLKTIQV